MVRRIVVLLSMVCLLGPARNWIAAQQPAAPATEKRPKDQAEYELIQQVQAAAKSNDGAKTLKLLDQWKEKYPDTAYTDDRLGFYMQAYQQTGQLPKAIEVGKEILSKKPDDFGANFTIAMVAPGAGTTNPKLPQEDPTFLPTAEKAANALLSAPKPAHVPEAQWPELKKTADIVAHQTLGWTAWQQKKLDVAEREFIKTLELTPGAAQVSYWLGLVVRENPDKSTLALYSFARATAYDGQGALPPNVRQQIDQFLTKAYNNYHGEDPKGLAELKTLAKSSPLPPPDLKIKNKEEIKAEKEEELKKQDPLMATFVVIKQRLTEEGDAFWQSMKGTSMPELKGTVVSATPALRPKTLTLAMTQSTEPEVTLTLETPLPRKIDPGAVIRFAGAEPVEYTPNPFMIKMQGGKITAGLPEAPPATKKSAPGKKSAPAKKKAG